MAHDAAYAERAFRHWAEARVAGRLTRRGWILLDHDAVVPGGELDLVFKDGRTVVFVEVRQRADLRFGGPAASLRPSKLRRLRRAARSWLARHGRRHRLPADPPVRIDAVLVVGGPLRPRIAHLHDVA